MNNYRIIVAIFIVAILISAEGWSGEWTQKTNGATPRLDHSAIVYNGKIYIFGG